jgi:transposase
LTGSSISCRWRALGFAKAVPKETGRKPYHPGDLLKLYLYGYLNQVGSSRRLERECQRNLELWWLLGRLAPDFKTIADFRRDNGPAIVASGQAFVTFCQQHGLLGQRVAVDGSKFRSAGSRDRSLNRAQHHLRDRSGCPADAQWPGRDDRRLQRAGQRR